MVPKKITKHYLLFALFTAHIFFIATPLFAMLTKQELANKKKREARQRGDQESTALFEFSDTPTTHTKSLFFNAPADIAEYWRTANKPAKRLTLTPEDLTPEKKEQTLSLAIACNDLEAVEKAKAAGAGDDDEKFIKEFSFGCTAVQEAVRYGCIPPIIRLLYDNNNTKVNDKLIYDLFGNQDNPQKQHFYDTTLTLINLGASTKQKHYYKNFGEVSLLKLTIEKYSEVANYVHQPNSHVHWKAVAYNLGAVTCLLAYVDSINMQRVLNQIAPAHRSAFIREHGENARNRFLSTVLRRKSAVLCLEDNKPLLPEAIRHFIADFLALPNDHDPELEKIRAKNWLENQENQSWLEENRGNQIQQAQATCNSKKSSCSLQ